MVSFQCEGCGDIVKKPKCKVHRCRAPFTCIDCHQTFNGASYQSHNQCMTEDQKYQKGYKPPTKKQQQQAKPVAAAAAPAAPQPTGLIAQLEKKKEETEKKRSLEEEENAQLEAKETKKTKVDVDTKKSKDKKDKKEKKKAKSLSEWSADELDSDETKQMELALHFILKKDKTAHSIESLREQVVALISSHPKSPKDIKSSTLKTKFDQVVGLTFNTKKNKIAYTFIKN